MKDIIYTHWAPPTRKKIEALDNLSSTHSAQCMQARNDCDTQCQAWWSAGTQSLAPPGWSKATNQDCPSGGRLLNSSLCAALSSEAQMEGMIGDQMTGTCRWCYSQASSGPCPTAALSWKSVISDCVLSLLLKCCQFEVKQVCLSDNSHDNQACSSLYLSLFVDCVINDCFQGNNVMIFSIPTEKGELCHKFWKVSTWSALSTRVLG